MSIKKKKWRDILTMKNINIVIKYLTVSDLILISGFGMLSPIFAIFITEQIEGGSVEVAGIASAIYLFSKSLSQIPLANFLDRIKGERDDFWALFLGTSFYIIIPIIYLYISTPIQLYIVQFFYGLAASLTFPSWMAIFTRHIDKEREATEWGVYYTLVDLGGAFAASMGGFFVNRFGFNNLFLLMSFLGLIATIFTWGIKKSIYNEKYGK